MDQLLRARERVVTHAELRAAGLAASTITHRIRPDGPWQRLLPGVVLAHTGTPTAREKLLGAVAYAGRSAVVTGSSSLLAQGVRVNASRSQVHLLIDGRRQRRSHGYVLIERSRRLPTPVHRSGIAFAPVSRAVVDACRHLQERDAVRELVAQVVQTRACTIAALTEEVRASARQRTALTRAALAEVDAGVRSVAEARIRKVMIRVGIPLPEWNVDLLTLDGEFIATPDAYWEQWAAALEIDSMRWHLDPRSYRRTQRRQRELTNRGVLVHPVAPADAYDDEVAFVASLRDFLHEAGRRVPPTGLVVRRGPRAA